MYKRQELDFDLFDKNVGRTIIILSEEDCIIQYGKFYIEYLLGRIKEETYKGYETVKDEISKMLKVLDVYKRQLLTTIVVLPMQYFMHLHNLKK